MNIRVGDYLMTTNDIYCINTDKNISPFTILEIRNYYDYNNTYEIMFKNEQNICEEAIISKSDIIFDCVKLKFEYIDND